MENPSIGRFVPGHRDGQKFKPKQSHRAQT
jgi:hypothetical protein